jgi:hypothetical protein
MLAMLGDLLERWRLRNAPDERSLYPHLFAGTRRVPDVTVGTIVFRALVKLLILMLITWFVLETYKLQYYWLVPLALVYFIVVLPAYHQYQRFYAESKEATSDLICSKCKHFDSTGVLCTLYDEHVSKKHIPCDGDAWEARTSWERD